MSAGECFGPSWIWMWCWFQDSAKNASRWLIWWRNRWCNSQMWWLLLMLRPYQTSRSVNMLDQKAPTCAVTSTHKHSIHTLWMLLNQKWRDVRCDDTVQVIYVDKPSPDIWPSVCTMVLFHPGSYSNILYPMVSSQMGWDTVNHSSMQENIQNSISHVIISCVKTGDQSRVPINETMYNNTPAYKT